MKKTVILIIHVLSILAFVAGFSALYVNNTGDSGITWVNAGDYSESPQFAAAVNSDIGRLKTLALYTDVFGDVDEIAEEEDPAVVSANTPDGQIDYSMSGLIKYAEQFGWTIDLLTGQTKTAQNASAEADNFDIRILDKKYDPDYIKNLEPGPSQGVMSIKELSIDALKTLSAYIMLRRELVDEASNFQYILYYPGINEDCVIITNTDLRSDSILKLPRYVHASGMSEEVDTNISPVTTAAVYVPRDRTDTETAEYYELSVGIDTSYPYSDRYSSAAAEFRKQSNMAYTWIGVAVLGFVIAVITLIFILKDAAEENGRHPADRLPVESFICIMAALAVLLYYVFKLTLCRAMEAMAPFPQQQYWRTVAKSLIVYGMSVLIAGSCIRRYRAGTLYKTSLFNRLELQIEDYLLDSGTAGSVLIRFLAFIGINIFLAVEAFVRYSQRMADSRNILLSCICITGVIILDLLCYGRLFRTAKQREKIDGALKNISEGETAVNLSEEEFTGQELETAKSINNISVGLMSAVSDQVKSERLKADLITNVSHDIKTPLTSIISYIGLLKRENINNDKANEYIEILERKSERLKNLTEDLVEASKASSGNIRIDFTKLDLVELTEQAAAEFEEKFSLRGLEFCLTKPEAPVYVNADGRHLWRVFENLFNNAFKYSLEGTRIYGDAGSTDENAFFTIKNVSAMKLNISPEELTERFVRGDISRTTEGSGLGLSIAKSLASLMGGELKIEIDGDLYKATVILPVYKGQENENQTH